MKKLILLLSFILGFFSFCFADNESNANPNDLKKEFSIGIESYRAQQYPKAFTIFQELSKKGHNRSQYMLGVMYLRGEGQKQNYERAFYWFHESAKASFSPAQYMLAELYIHGYGVEENIEMAFQWALKSAELGFVEAQVLVSRMFVNGEGVAKDEGQALAWAQEAAQKGHAHAQYLFGYYIYKGIGHESRPDIGEYWLRQSATSGHLKAMLELSLLLDKKPEKGPFDESPLTEKEKANLCSSKEADIWLENAALLDQPEALTRQCVYNSGKSAPGFIWLDGYAWCQFASESNVISDEHFKKLVKEGLDHVTSRLSTFDINKAKIKLKKLREKKSKHKFDAKLIEKAVEECKKRELEKYAKKGENKPAEVSDTPSDKEKKVEKPLATKDISALSVLFQKLDKSLKSNSIDSTIKLLSSFEHPAKQNVLAYLSSALINNNQIKKGLRINELIDDETQRSSLVEVAYYQALYTNNPQETKSIYKKLNVKKSTFIPDMIRFRVAIDQDNPLKALEIMKEDKRYESFPMFKSVLLYNLIRVGKHQQAQQLVESIGEKERSRSKLYDDYVSALAKFGYPDKANTFFKKIQEDDPDFTLKPIAMAYAKQKKYSRAIKIVEMMTDESNGFSAYGIVASIAAYNGDEKVVNNLLSKISNNRSKQEALAEITKGYAKSGQFQKAAHTITAIDNRNELYGAQIELIKAYVKQGELTKARKVASQVERERASILIDATVELVKGLNNAGLKEESTKTLKEVIDRIPDIRYAGNIPRVIFDIQEVANDDPEIFQMLIDSSKAIKAASQRWNVLTKFLFYKHFKYEIPEMFKNGANDLDSYLDAPTPLNYPLYKLIFFDQFG